MNEQNDRDYRELEKVDDRIEELFDELSPEAIEAEARANGVDTAAIEVEVRGLFAAAYKRASQRLLREARAEHERCVEVLTRPSYDDIPTDVEEQVALLTALQSAQPQLLAQMTLKHREFKNLSNSDRTSLLRQLKALGALDALRSKEPENES